MMHFLSCDWGTSNFRLRLVDRKGLEVFAEIQSAEGVSSVHRRWKQEGTTTDRTAFFRKHLQGELQKLKSKTKITFEDSVLVLSGMASSSIGMLELAYKPLPIKTDGTDLIVQNIDADKILSNPILLISGASTDDDVMRGEETQLLGCDIYAENKSQLFIFPGTHSKHIWVKDQLTISLKTYMTGEYFSLLSKQSILSGSVSEENAENTDASEAFKAGVLDGKQSNLLNASFKVRVQFLQQRYTAHENYQYLSGLLIGAELGEIKKSAVDLLTLVAGSPLIDQYKQALSILGFNEKVTLVDGSTATAKGQAKILQATLSRV